VSDRVYVLLDIVDGKSEEVAQSLWGKPGVVKADLLEGSPDLILICEAMNHRKLAKLTVEALAVVEQVTENVCLLPVRSQLDSAGKRKSFNLKETLKGEPDA
jgi:hypothetical protein